jgi:hypothetical protein
VRILAAAAPFALLLLGATPAAGQARRPRNVIVVTLDGMRWQEVFGGADSVLLNSSAVGPEDTAPTFRRYWRKTPAERRAALMPFLWNTIAAQGQIFGDSIRGSYLSATNGFWFSYPGYNELFTGRPDPRIGSNDPIWNPNVTVFEWLSGKAAYRGRVIAWGGWELLPYILDTARSHLPANGLNPPYPHAIDDEERVINRMAGAELAPWDDGRLDAPAMAAALHDLRTRRPRVLYVMLGETDSWGHERRYDFYLDAAARADHFLADLWRAAQALPEYRGNTALIVATDHGRGATLNAWPNHDFVAPARRIWMAVLGPDTPPLGVRHVGGTQGQFAATIAALLGEDYAAAVPGTPPPLSGAVQH